MRTLRIISTFSGTFWFYQIPLMILTGIVYLTAPWGPNVTPQGLKEADIGGKVTFLTLQALSIAQNANRPLITFIGLLIVHRKLRDASYAVLKRMRVRSVNQPTTKVSLHSCA